MTYKPDIVIWHAGCLDGFTAAWAIWKRWPDAEFYAGAYGSPLPDVTGKKVLFVDFSAKRPALLEMAKTAKYITILDHHRTAQDDLADWALAPFMADDGIALGVAPPGNIQAWFDMDKSGARLAWDWAYGGSAPAIVEHVEDRDLWRFNLDFTREVCAALGTLEMDFRVWDRFSEAMHTDDGRDMILAEGSAVLRSQSKVITDIIGATKRRMAIGGHDVPVANCPHMFASEAGNIMCQGEPFAATYYDTGKGMRAFSLRSTDAGVDVSAIASQFAGGGHRNAAGFAVPIGFEPDVLTPQSPVRIGLKASDS